jgi:DNA-binding transcriptional MerR regulator
MRYRIGEFARLSGASVKALRFYDRLGILEPAAVDVRTGYRLYEAAQLQDIAAIFTLKDLGASLAEIRRVISRPRDSTERRRLLESLRARALASIDTARRSLQWLELALAEVETCGVAVPVSIKHRPQVRVASIRTALRSYGEVDEVERELRRAVSLQRSGDLRGVLWHRCEDSGRIEGEPFVETAGRATRGSIYEVKDLPAVTAATAYCAADDEAAVRAYEALSRWISLRSYRLAGPKREIYLGPILEIQFPIEPA